MTAVRGSFFFTRGENPETEVTLTYTGTYRNGVVVKGTLVMKDDSIDVCVDGNKICFILEHKDETSARGTYSINSPYDRGVFHLAVENAHV